MGPRLKVDNNTFLAELSKSDVTVVIKGPKVMMQGFTYLFHGEDYYYYTVSKEPLNMPKDVKITNVSQILL